jgi:hypothetical protein
LALTDGNPLRDSSGGRIRKRIPLRESAPLTRDVAAPAKTPSRKTRSMKCPVRGAPLRHTLWPIFSRWNNDPWGSLPLAGEATRIEPELVKTRSADSVQIRRAIHSKTYAASYRYMFPTVLHLRGIIQRWLTTVRDGSACPWLPSVGWSMGLRRAILGT